MRTAIIGCAIVAIALVAAPIAHAKPGDALVADQRSLPRQPRRPVRVDPASGAPATLASGAPFDDPIGIAVEASGQILVADESAAGGPGALFRVDPASGARATLASGAPFSAPTGVAVEASGQILVVDPAADPGALGALFRVDPASGAADDARLGGAVL